MKTRTTLFFVISALLICGPAYGAIFTASDFVDVETELLKVHTGFSEYDNILDSGADFDWGLAPTGTGRTPRDTTEPPTDPDLPCQAGLPTQLPEPATLVFLGMGCMVFAKKQ